MQFSITFAAAVNRFLVLLLPTAREILRFVLSQILSSLLETFCALLIAN